MEIADDILDEVDVSETSSNDPVVSRFDTAQQDQQDLVAKATEVSLTLPADTSTAVFLNDSQATNNVEISGIHEETASFAALELSPEQVAGYHLDIILQSQVTSTLMSRHRYLHSRTTHKNCQSNREQYGNLANKMSFRDAGPW